MTIHTLLETLARHDGASDLILTVGVSPQLRIHREMIPLNHPELTDETMHRFCTDILSPQQYETFEQCREYDFSYTLNDQFRFRINIFRQQQHTAMVARIIMDRVPDREKLRLPPAVEQLAQLTSGMVMLTGPTGSGKSTTLAAMIDYVNNHRACHIVCIEDPIEYIHHPVLSTINQREVGSDTDSYAEALRRVLRQSPDVIVIGEIRDRDSAQAAVTLAETGHLLLTTMHTRGAISAINRMIDLFPPEQTRQMRSQLASSLMGVIWQQLLPARDQDGLILACEIMIVTPAIRALIMNGNTHEIVSMLQTGRKFGMCTMEQAITDLEQQQLIDGTSTQQKGLHPVGR